MVDRVVGGVSRAAAAWGGSCNAYSIPQLVNLTNVCSSCEALLLSEKYHNIGSVYMYTPGSSPQYINIKHTYKC